MILAVALFSCTKEDISDSTSENICVSISKEQLDVSISHLNAIRRSTTRDVLTHDEVDEIEKASKDILSVYTEEGRRLRDLLLNDPETLDSEREQLMALSDEALTYSAFVLATAQYEANGVQTRGNSAGHAIACGFQAVSGLTFSGGLMAAGVKGIAKATIRAGLIAGGKMLVGGVGVIFTVISFVDCMDWW